MANKDEEEMDENSRNQIAAATQKYRQKKEELERLEREKAQGVLARTQEILAVLQGICADKDVNELLGARQDFYCDESGFFLFSTGEIFLVACPFQTGMFLQLESKFGKRIASDLEQVAILLAREGVNPEDITTAFWKKVGEIIETTTAL